jgi:biofilm PGA synthesis N-glycosyltransferase PgaC
MLRLPKYVLITPARNEARYIELTIRSVVAQTVRPLKWVIVSDGSTDGTDEIVARYLPAHPWIELVRMPERLERHFAGKVNAFNAGHTKAAGIPYDIIGNLDADVSFEAEHFRFLLEKLAEDSRLGVVGAPFREGTHQYNYDFSSIENVWGGCQLFRRECLEDIGGYVPVKGGSIDHIAVVSARMKGWATRTFTEKVCVHHREMGTAQQNAFTARFRTGAKDYSVGNHPVWELFRAFYQMTQSPVVLGGILLACGYTWSMVRRVSRPVSSELVAFTRHEQMERLRRFLADKTPMRFVLKRSARAF